MAPRPAAGDLLHMAIAVWIGVGLALGAVAHALARDRLPLGLEGAAVAGSLGGLFGATAQSLLEGSNRFHLDPASVAGSACGAALLVMLLARAGRRDTRPWRDAS